MGSDTRVGKGNGGFGSVAEFGDAQRSDTVIVLHIAADRKSAIGVSIPRDTIIDLPTCKQNGKKVGGYSGRFNEAIEIGGPGCTLKAVKEMSGLDISNFMLVDFGGFKRIVDAVGGVEICLAAPVDDPLSGLKLDKGKHLVRARRPSPSSASATASATGPTPPASAASRPSSPRSSARCSPAARCSTRPRCSGCSMRRPSR